ncbi:MAG: hypothetical protein KKD44_19100 [Proteobacteria bacterium]|nr:hypothetical protein [Pseudomonadota bacterium]
MRGYLSLGLLATVFASFIHLTGCSGGGGSAPPPATVIVSGAVNDQDIPGATVSLKSLVGDETLASTTCEADGTYLLNVTRGDIETADYLLTATHPVNGRSLRSLVAGADIKATATLFSSRLTVISAYTEAAFLDSKTRNSSDSPLSFLNQSIRITDTKFPLSTGVDSVDALANWIKGRFTAASGESGTLYTLNLIAEILGTHWPVFFVNGSDVSITVAPELIEGGAVLSVVSFDGADSVTVDGGTVTVTPAVAGSQGQVVLQISLGETDKTVTLPINTAGTSASTQQTLQAFDNTIISFGNLILQPDRLSFTRNTDLTLTELDLSALADTSMGDITLVAAFDVHVSIEPSAPVTLIYQAEGDQDPDKTVLIHINSATKRETYVYPDSYDAVTHRFIFTLSSFSPILIGTLAYTPAYTMGSTITATDLSGNSAKVFGFIRNLSDTLGDEARLEALGTVSGNEDKIIDYLTRLSSKALASFMALPVSDASGLNRLKDITFKPQWLSLSTVRAYDEYWRLRTRLMQALYRVTNTRINGIGRTLLNEYNTAHGVELETDISPAILGQADADGYYYLSMMAYRVLRRGLQPADAFFENTMETITSEGLDESAFLTRYEAMAEWLQGYIAYKLFVSPKVYESTRVATDQGVLVLSARSFFSDSSRAAYAGLWLGGSYPYASDNDVTGAAEGFAGINDTLNDLSVFQSDLATIRTKVQNDSQYPLGSALNGRNWVDRGAYYIPPEINDEITNLTNWLAYLRSLLPEVSTWYRDSDGDGYGDPETSTEASLRPDGYVADNTDPNDANATIYPDSREICGDSVDNDLNGLIDEGCSSHYKGTETTVPLQRKSNNQFLIPVDVGNQTLNLLVDTGSDALLVFADKLAVDTTVLVSATPFTKSYASTTRSGFLAQAAVQIGAYSDPDMTIMVVTSPTSDNDPSLTAKQADGIIGLRRTQGMSISNGTAYPDAPLNTLEPTINIFELNLPPTGPASISFGHMTTLDRAKPQYVFKAKTYTFLDPEHPADASYADLQVPFRAKSKYGEANTGELDVLLDSGAVSKLVLDTEVAKSLGYDSFTNTWNLNDDDEIEFNLVGAGDTITIYPKFKVSEISVAPLSQLGVTYEAVLGIDRWQHYVVGFSYLDYQSGGPDGTILMLFRPNMAEAYRQKKPGDPLNYEDLTGLNSLGDDRFPTADETGDLIAFQSNRPGGMGGWDIYLWRKGEGLLTYPNLNSTGDDADPSLSGDGRYLVFYSNRDGGVGGWDIYLYDIENRVFVDTPGLNSTALDRTPTLSTDGRYIAFRSERDGGEGGSDIYLYDRQTESLVALPGLNTADGEFDPVLNQDGSLIAFDRDTYVDDAYDSSVYLYNVATHTLDTLSDINGESWDMDAVVSPTGTYLTCHTNRHNPAMELYDRNFLIYNRETARFELLSGLNTDFDEEGLCFTGNEQSILFHSSRPGGMGGSDIYVYNLAAETNAAVEESDEDLPGQTIPVIRDEESGADTLTVTTGDGTDLILLLDTGVSGILLFADRAPTGNRCNGPVSVNLPYGTLNASEQICLAVTVGGETAETEIPVIGSQSEYNTLVHRSDLPAVDGVIGFRGNFQNEFDPKMLFIEYSFIDSEPGLTIGTTPMTSLARGQGEYVFDTWLDGVIDPIDPVNKSYTNMDLTFIARSNTGEESEDGNLAMLSTMLKDALILDFETARSLGYSEITGWGVTSEVSLFFANDVYILPVEMGAYAVEKIVVADLSEQHCQAVLSADRWMDSFIVGFATIDYQFGGPWGTVSLLHVKDLPALQGDTLSKGRNYISLPGLNSASDDDYPTVSIDGQTIAFQSSRNGDKDIFVYKIGQGLVYLPGLNSGGDDEHPCISGDGRLVVFHSNRSGTSDVYLYDIEAGDFIDLPGLNTEYEERQPSISADGAMLAFRSQRPDSVGGSWDIYLYSVTNLAMADINGAWVNTEADEEAPVLSQDATLLSFVAYDRPDSFGDSDVFVYDLLRGELLDLPEGTNETYWNDGVIGVDGKFVLCTYYEDTTDYIKLMELSSGEFIYLPGLNTPYNDWGLQATPNAQYIVFESDRPGGEGGWDIYVYQRDETDTNTYTVTTAYNQSGYVTDADGNRVADEEIRAYDKTGTLIGATTTDGDGNFTLTVPQGSQLGITFESVTADLSIITDDVGDDTYVPDFEAGNLKFTEVWIEDTAQAGMTSSIHFDIEATVPKYNTYVTVYLKAGNPGDIVVDDAFVPDYELTSLLIDKLGFRGTATDPVVKEQKDMTTSVTYYPDTDNKKAYVEHTFIVPQGIADGIYTAVFAINTYDVSREDDALQGESDEDLADNYMVASASTIIGNPTLPNVRILSYELYTNSFDLPAESPDPDVVPEQYDLSLNLEVESMGQDVTDPVDITFELAIGGTSYPMTFAEPNESNVLRKKDKQTYEVTCRPEEREGYPEGDRCASLFRQEQTGKTYSLFMSAAAYDALNSMTEDTLAYLTIKMDPDLIIEEYNDNKADNTVTLPVMFLAPESEAKSSKMINQPGSTAGNLFNLKGGNFYGNDDFGIGYEIGPKMDYRQITYDGFNMPYAVNFNGTASFNATLFGMSVTPLEAGPKFDFDFSNGGLEQSYLEYGVWAFGLRIWGPRVMMPSDFRAKGSFTIWDTKDDNGNEMYAKRKEKKKSKTFMVGPVPVTVEGGIVGEIGIRGSLNFLVGNKLSMEAGPFLSLYGFLEGGVGVPGFKVGIGIELVLMDVALKFNPSLMVRPEVPIAIFELKVPITLNTMSGSAYLFARAFLWSYKYYIIGWSGYTYEINLFPLWYKGYGATDLYNVSYYPSNNYTGTSVAGSREGILAHDWGAGGPSELGGRTDNFSAVYSGFFEFSAVDKYIWGNTNAGFGSNYTFYVISDDSLTITVDDSPILSNFFGTTQFTESITAGFHELKVNFAEYGGLARAQVYWTAPNQFATFYYNNTTLTGDPVLFETTNEINERWGGESPKPGIVNADNFSVKYEGDFTFPVTGDYLFTALADDVVRIYVDNAIVLNNNSVWYEPASSTVAVTAGIHKVRVEYVEYGGAANIRVGWAPKNTYAAVYYNTRVPAGNPALIRDDGGFISATPGLWDHVFLANFGNDRPATQVAYDNFSVIWEGAFYFDGGDYDFVMTRDDEMTVWVDDMLIGSYTNVRADLVTKKIAQGWHIVRISYVDHDWRALASLKWGKKKKNIVTEYFCDHWKTPFAINRRNDMVANWGHGAPPGEFALWGDDYHVIWEGDFDFDGAPYRFKAGADDVMTLWLDNIRLLDAAWRDWETYDYEVLPMNKGTHHIKVVFFENHGGAWAHVSWQKIDPEEFIGLKFDSGNTDYALAIDTNASNFNYDWSLGSPGGTVDHFLIKWLGVFTFPTDGTYRFYGTSDDDIYFYIDNEFVYSRGCCGGYSFEKYMKAGQHSIHADYWEHSGGASVGINWERQ